MELPCRKYIHSFTHLPCWCSYLIEFASQRYSFANSFHDHLFFSHVWCQIGTRFFVTITFHAAKLLRCTSAWKKFKISSNFSMVFSRLENRNHYCESCRIFPTMSSNINGTDYCENFDSRQKTKLVPFTVSRWRLKKPVTVSSWWAPYTGVHTILEPVYCKSSRDIFCSFHYRGNHSGGGLESNSCASVIGTTSVNL
jgi:hypothetical protein